jgi:chromosome segregation ATPase
MSQKTMDERVGALEKTAESLAVLPDRVSDMGERLANVEVRLTTVDSRLTNVEVRLTTVEVRLTTVESQIVELRTDLTAAKNEIREDIATLGREMAGQILETRRHAQVLHDAVIACLATCPEEP